MRATLTGRLARAVLALLLCAWAASARPADAAGAADATSAANASASAGAAAHVPAVLDLSVLASPLEPAAMRHLLLPRRALDAPPPMDDGRPVDGLIWQTTQQPFELESLNRDNEAWIHLRLRNREPDARAWQLHFDLPAADLVMVYQRGPQGWTVQRAGDHLESGSWPMDGRFPRFVLELPGQSAHDVIVRVRNANASPLAVRLVSQAQAESIQRREYLAIGLALGVALLVVGACLAQAWVYRDRDYAGYALYAVLFGLLVASNTGVASEFLWGHWPRWSDPAKNALPLIAACASALLMARLCRTAQRRPWLARVGLAAAAACGAMGLTVVAWPASTLVLLPLGVAVSLAFVAIAAGDAWRRGDPVGAWVLASYVPPALAAVAILSRFMDLPVPRFSAYGLLAASLVASLPILLVAIHLRSRDSHAMRVRERELATHDPLTGALAAHLMSDRLQALVDRQRRRPQDAAVLYVRLSNLDRIAQVLGPAAADQALIRAAIRLNRVLEDADAVGRVAPDTFAVILESVTTREGALEVGSRIVAHGLMAARGNAPRVTLAFHVAGTLLSESPLDAQHIHDALSDLLAQMARGTRRAVQLVGAGPSEPQRDASADAAAAS